MIKEKECIFCKIAKKEIKTENIAETNNFYAFPDANPISKGHTLIIPKKHYTDLLEIDEKLGEELLKIIKEVGEKKLKEGAEGFNLIVNTKPAAGQVIMHLHFHIIPRRKGDNVKLH